MRKCLTPGTQKTRTRSTHEEHGDHPTRRAMSCPTLAQCYTGRSPTVCVCPSRHASDHPRQVRGALGVCTPEASFCDCHTSDLRVCHAEPETWHVLLVAAQGCYWAWTTDRGAQAHGALAGSGQDSIPENSPHDGDKDTEVAHFRASAILLSYDHVACVVGRVLKRGHQHPSIIWTVRDISTVILGQLLATTDRR